MKTLVNAKQCTLLWNVDDLKVSNDDTNIVSCVLADIDVEYGNIAKTNITKDKIHKYHRMTIDYSSPDKVIFSMIDCIGNMIDEMPGAVKGESATPAAHNLFEIAEDTTRLYQTDTEFFHYFVVQLLYPPKR